MKQIKNTACGFFIGITNALFASGGGLIAVPVLKSMGQNQKTAQANALAVILPLSFISMIIYYLKDYFNFSQAFKYIPFGFAGALLGTKLLKKIPNKILKKIFSLFILWAGIRMIFK